MNYVNKRARRLETHFVSGAELQRNVLSHCRRRTVRPWLVSFLNSEFRPRLAFCDGMLNEGLLKCALDPPCDLPDVLQSWG